MLFGDLSGTQQSLQEIQCNLDPGVLAGEPLRVNVRDKHQSRAGQPHRGNIKGGNIENAGLEIVRKVLYDLLR